MALNAKSDWSSFLVYDAACLEDNALSASAHIEGMTRIVLQSGGVPMTATDEALSRLISWADMTYSSTWPSEPHLPLLFESPTPFNSAVRTTAAANGEFCLAALETVLAPDLVHVVGFMNDLPSRPTGETSSAAERQRASRAIYNIERLLITYGGPEPSAVSRVAFSRMFQAAAQLYVLLALRDLPVHTPKISRWTETLAERIGAIPSAAHDVYDITAQTVLLWSHAVLVAARPDLNNDETWVAFRVVMDLPTDLNMSSATVLTATLKQITWADNFGKNELDNLLIAIDRRRRMRK
ncbi:hypothetical protein LTR08_004617 [Meristemomyces frigidus]|nr:hypothetical protein LTR08_004617 [Meristemomyces frigidus]